MGAHLPLDLCKLGWRNVAHPRCLASCVDGADGPQGPGGLADRVRRLLAGDALVPGDTVWVPPPDEPHALAEAAPGPPGRRHPDCARVGGERPRSATTDSP